MGVSTIEQNSDLAALIAGGDAFVRRTKELKDAKDSYEKALAAFNLGQDAVAAYKDAAAKQAEATKALEDAKHIVNEAMKAAEHIQAEARAKVDEIMKAGEAKRDETMRALDHEVKSGREELAAWVKSEKGKINADREALNVQIAQVAKEADELRRAKTEVATAQKAASKARTDADAAIKLYTDKVNKLNAALSGV